MNGKTCISPILRDVNVPDKKLGEGRAACSPQPYTLTGCVEEARGTTFLFRGTAFVNESQSIRWQAGQKPRSESGKGSALDPKRKAFLRPS